MADGWASRHWETWGIRMVLLWIIYVFMCEGCCGEVKEMGEKEKRGR